MKIMSLGYSCSYTHGDKKEKDHVCGTPKVGGGINFMTNTLLELVTFVFPCKKFGGKWQWSKIFIIIYSLLVAKSVELIKLYHALCLGTACHFSFFTFFSIR